MNGFGNNFNNTGANVFSISCKKSLLVWKNLVSNQYFIEFGISLVLLRNEDMETS